MEGKPFRGIHAKSTTRADQNRPDYNTKDGVDKMKVSGIVETHQGAEVNHSGSQRYRCSSIRISKFSPLEKHRSKDKKRQNLKESEKKRPSTFFPSEVEKIFEVRGRVIISPQSRHHIVQTYM